MSSPCVCPHVNSCLFGWLSGDPPAGKPSNECPPRKRKPCCLRYGELYKIEFQENDSTYKLERGKSKAMYRAAQYQVDEGIITGDIIRCDGLVLIEKTPSNQTAAVLVEFKSTNQDDIYKAAFQIISTYYHLPGVLNPKKRKIFGRIITQGKGSKMVNVPLRNLPGSPEMRKEVIIKMALGKLGINLEIHHGGTLTETADKLL